MDYLVCYDIVEDDDDEYDRRDRAIVSLMRNLAACHLQDSVWRVQRYTQAQIATALNKVIGPRDRVVISLIQVDPLIHNPLQTC